MRVGPARKLDCELQVLTRLGSVSDAPEDATEDAMCAARGANLAEALGKPQRLL
jgi:hypothetical protein